MSDLEFKGQVALVTGASRGIGAAIALELAQRGLAVGIQRHDGERHGGVGDVVAVEVDGFEWPGAA